MSSVVNFPYPGKPKDYMFAPASLEKYQDWVSACTLRPLSLRDVTATYFLNHLERGRYSRRNEMQTVHLFNDFVDKRDSKCHFIIALISRVTNQMCGFVSMVRNEDVMRVTEWHMPNAYSWMMFMVVSDFVKRVGVAVISLDSHIERESLWEDPVQAQFESMQITTSSAHLKPLELDDEPVADENDDEQKEKTTDAEEKGD